MIDEVIADRYCQIGLEIRAAWSADRGIALKKRPMLQVSF